LLQRKKNIVDSISIKEIGNLKFKDFQVESHNIFRWVLQVVYKESTSQYYWPNFKKQALEKDKGTDFIARLKGLPLTKLRKDDFSLSKQVLEHRDAYLAELEKKDKPIPSLRSLFDYISIVNEAGDALEVVDHCKVQIEEKEVEASQHVAEKVRLNNLLSVLEGKLQASKYYISRLENLTPLFQRIATSTQNRSNLQNQYVNVIRGDSSALQHLVNQGATATASNVRQQPTTNTEQSYNQRRSLPQNVISDQQYQQERAVASHPHLDQENQESVDVKKHQQQSYHGEGEESDQGSQANVDVVVNNSKRGSQAQSQAQSQAHSKAQSKANSQAYIDATHTGGITGHPTAGGEKTKYPVPSTDLKESEFANSKKGSCESCNIF